MKPKTYVILLQAIEEGVKQGWYRAHKNNDKPSEEIIRETIEDSVMSSIHDYFIFDESEYV